MWLSSVLRSSFAVQVARRFTPAVLPEHAKLFSQRLDYSSISQDPDPNEVTLEKLDEEWKGVAVVSLCRPKARNAIGRRMLGELQGVLRELAADPLLRAVVLRSKAEHLGVFCAGADLRERKAMTPAEASQFVNDLRGTFTALQNLPLPVIAAIEGAALGGGLELALACDLRVAGHNAKLGLPEASIGIIPGAGGTQRLARLVGPARAKELIFTARRITPATGVEIGLVEYAVDEGDAFDRALELAKEMTPQAPLSLRLAKMAVNRGIEVDLASGLAFEEAYYAQTLSTSDRLEGLKAFAEKRKPVFTGE